MADVTLQDIADEALAATGSASAAIFLVDATGALRLGAAAGVTGEPLERLVAAVQSPAHPIAITARIGESAFDVTPVAPGGPALRSHITITAPGRPTQVIGVLALAHDRPLNPDQRRAAADLAARAANSDTSYADHSIIRTMGIVLAIVGVAAIVLALIWFVIGLGAILDYFNVLLHNPPAE